ncbi:hypothetical protein ABZX40_35280 [Streptomyces sp. NPDC004610]|uniref:hypothetical protein n=1 Tax=unclassified Streptomyces TaxID=2593676 RepID=UPI0033AD281B
MASSAAYDSTVGIQAETVHNSSVYIVQPDATPQEQYKVGVKSLQDGIPSRARDVFNDVIARGYDNAEVRFHWVLALLSTRAFHELSREETKQLHHVAAHLGEYAEGEWKDALRAVFELLRLPSTADGEPDRVLKRLRALPPGHRDAIIRHLDLILTGGLKDSLWAENRERAEADRFANDRTQRVWAYFELDPAEPRALPPGQSTAAAAREVLPLWATLFAATTGILWIFALLANPAMAVLELTVALAAVPTAAYFGRQWWYQDRWLKTRSRASQADGHATAGDGFTNSVHQAFHHCFSTQVPPGCAPDLWLHQTARIRFDLVGEVAFLYRASRIHVDQVGWLIRHLTEDALDRYGKGTLFKQRHRSELPMGTRTLCVIVLVALGTVISALLRTAASGAGEAYAVLAVLAAAGAVCFGYLAGRSWLEAWGEDHRLATETQAYVEELAARRAAYATWKNFLDGKRPSEQEMESWLTCDKTLLVDEALRHYELTWRDPIAYTILMTPARPYKRGRVRNGPWRYSRYTFRLFLVTQDGMREISTDYDFADARSESERRSNYRFDALSSVQVAEHAQVGYDLELILTNGPARIIRVKDADTHQLAPDENAQEIAEINRDAAGFVHTFRLLEGIAADGKGWIERNIPHTPPPFLTTD